MSKRIKSDPEFANRRLRCFLCGKLIFTRLDGCFRAHLGRRNERRCAATDMHAMVYAELGPLAELRRLQEATKRKGTIVEVWVKKIKLPTLPPPNAS